MRAPPAIIEAALARIVTRRGALLVLAAALIVTVAAIASWRRLHFSTDLADVLGRSTPAASALADLQAHFEESNPLILLFESGDAHNDLRAVAHRIGTALRREADARRLPITVDLPSAAPPAFVQDVLLPAAPWYLDEVALDELARRAAPEYITEQIESAAVLLASPAPQAEMMARRRLADPLGVSELLSESLGPSAAAPADLSPDGRACRLRIFPAEGAIPDWPAVISLVNETAPPLLPDGVTLSLTGAPAIATLNEQQTKRDLIRGGLTGAALVAIVIVAAYRRPSAILVVLLPAALAIVWAFGLYAWTGMPLTPLTAAGVAILAGLGVDYSIHAASAVRSAASTQPQSQARALAAVAPAMACACATTIAACAALALSEVRLLHTLAALGALGLLSALAASLTVAPALASLARLAAVPTTTRPINTPRYAFVAALAVGALCLAAIALNLARGGALIPFHDSTAVLHPHPNPPLDAEARMDAAFREQGATIPILIRADTADALPARAAEIAAAINASPDLQTGRTLGVLSLAPRADTPRDPVLQRFWADVDPEATIASLHEAARRGGLAPAATAGAESLIRAVLSPSDPPTLDQLRAAGAPIDRFLAPHASPPLTVLLYRTPEPLNDRPAQQRTVSALRRALQPYPEARITGYAVLGLEAHHAVRRDFGVLTAAAGIAIGAILLLSMRSWRRALLVFIPVGYGLLLLLGLMHATSLFGIGVPGAGAGGLRLDMVSIAAVPLLLGIGVDDGVFLASHRRDNARAEVTRAALHAITTTSITTVVAFASLATSAMPALRTLGIAAAVAIGAAWVGAVCVLHPLLHRNRRVEKRL